MANVLDELLDLSLIHIFEIDNLEELEAVKKIVERLL